METWRPLPDPDYGRLYEVSDMGRVRSLHSAEPRILAGSSNSDGYRIMVLFNGRGGRKGFPLHRLVAEAFLADRRNALHNEVAHLDGDRKNASADNLKWCSKVENHSHKRLHGTHQEGDKAGHRILTSDQARIIRRRRRTASEFARQFGVSPHTIYDIWAGKRWQSVEDESAVRDSEFAQEVSTNKLSMRRGGE